VKRKLRKKRGKGTEKRVESRVSNKHLLEEDIRKKMCNGKEEEKGG
jgi:hypothetical protein